MSTTIRFEASAGVPPESLVPWREVARPTGETFGANGYHLTENGRPFPVVSGELIQQRYPREEWAAAIASLKASGCTMVSSYLFWGQVEPQPGEFDFSGDNDIRAFALACVEQGMLFSPRIGPFTNSEFLLGGLPPWLYGMPFTERSNDPGYLERVGRYFDAVGRELDGLYWQDGGPVIMVQLENELSHAPNDWSTLFGYTATDHRGPEGEEFTRHMTELKRLALAAGIDPPFFGMTGWGTAGSVPDSFIPSYGGYMDLHYRPGPNSRLSTFTYGDYPHRGERPVIFSELGTGSPTRAAYRPMSPPEMATTTALTRLGGVETVFLGYYLFHGGTNPVRGDGFGWTPKEPGFALRSYDFWAPYSEYGEPRASAYTLNAINRFVQDFGTELADMPVTPPDDPVTDSDDDRLRASLRSRGDAGFVFLSNYGNHTPLSDREDVRLSIRVGDRSVDFPRRRSLRVGSGEERILPVGLPLGGVTLTAGTSWPLARMERDGVVTLVAATREEEAEYLFAGVDAVAVTGGTEVSADADGAVVAAAPGTTVEIAADGGTARIVTLSWDEGLHLQSFGAGGSRVLVTSPDAFRGDTEAVVLERRRALGERGEAEAEALMIAATGETQRFELALPAPGVRMESIVCERISPTRMVLRVAEGVDIDDHGLNELWVDVPYEGDLCRLFDVRTGRLIADDFHHGIPWRIKLGRFASALRGLGVQLRAEPIAHKESIVDPAGLLLDSAMRTEGRAAIGEPSFSQLVRSAPLSLARL